MLNQKSEQSFFTNTDAAEASAAISFIGEDVSEYGEICPDLDFLRHEEGFSIGQQVYERDTLAPGTITAIDEDGIATVLFTNGNTDGVSLEHLVSNKE